MNHFRALAFLLFAFLPASISAASVRDMLKQPDAWFKTDEALAKATNILSHQSSEGCWPKNFNTSDSLFNGDPKSIKGTFDNGATTDELRFLARIFQQNHATNCQRAIERGFDHIIRAQYATGGWPQSYPPGSGYHRHITFNDDAMVRLMTFLRETYQSPLFSFLDANRKSQARAAFDKGIACILKCQVKVNGKLTAWCAQHDEITLEPRPARTFELVSLSGAESVGILRLLMSIENPSAELVEAVKAGVQYLDSVKITGIRVNQEKDARAPKGFNKIVVADSTAPPLWARFYEIGSNKPIFVDRDGIAKYKIDEIGFERRNGYAWYGEWPKRLIDTEFPAWLQKLKQTR